MKIISKEKAAELREKFNCSQEEAEKRFHLFGGDSEIFTTRFTVSCNDLTKDELSQFQDNTIFSEVQDGLKNSLQGSKWEGLVSQNREEFIIKKYRMLSSTMVQRVFDFTYQEEGKELPLKTAQEAGLFNNLKFYKDHQWTTEAMVGVVGLANFNYTQEPVGVDNYVFVNRELDPSFAKKFESEMVDSGSVGISFAKKPSHSFEDPWDFWALLGEEVEGETVRFLVTDIDRVIEFSAVAEGADPFAKVQNELKSEEVSMEEFTALKESIAITEESFAAREESLQSEIVELKAALDEKKENFEDTSAFASLLNDNGFNKEDIIDVLEEGLASLSRKKEDMVKFLTLTNRAMFAENVKAQKDIKQFNMMYDLFRSDMEKEFPAFCSDCGAEVETTRQSSANTPKKPETTIVIS